jgi:hypothetical protein
MTSEEADGFGSGLLKGGNRKLLLNLVDGIRP